MGSSQDRGDDAGMRAECLARTEPHYVVVGFVVGLALLIRAGRCAPESRWKRAPAARRHAGGLTTADGDADSA